MKKMQFTVDNETEKLLEQLAAPRAGNKSYVVREAVKRFAEQEGFEQYLDWLEQQPSVRRSLERGLADVRAGRTTPYREVVTRSGRKKRR